MLKGFSQSEKLLIEAKCGYGYIIWHHKSMRYLSKSHFPLFEGNIAIQTNGKNQWEQYSRYPIKGIKLLYIDLGNPDVLGKAFSIMPYLSFPLAKGKRLSFNFRFAMGMAYITKCFDRTANYTNTAIGSHLNAAVDLNFELRAKLCNSLSLTGGVGFTHFSNGAIKSPNLGLNIPAIYLGLAYKPSKKPIEYIKHDKPPYNKRIQYRVLFSYGISNMYIEDPKFYPSYALSGYFLKPVNIKQKIGLVFDLFYETENFEYLRRENVNLKSDIGILRPGLSLTYVFDFDKLSLILQMGGYLYTKYKGNGYIYDRLGLQYLVGKHYILNLALKTHFAVADHVEFGVGYKF